jgi:hypothetical protein
MNKMSIPLCLPAPLVPADMQAEEFRPGQVWDTFGLIEGICRSVERNQVALQQFSQSLDVTRTLVTGLKEDWERFSREIESDEACNQVMIRMLYKEVPMFSYYILALPDIKHILFKRRQFRMTFRLFDAQNCLTVVPGKMRYALKVFTCMPPYHELQTTDSSLPLIVGETEVDAENCDRFEFYDIAFTAGSAKYPMGFFNLVIMCLNSTEIEPLLVEHVNVRLKCKKVMVMKNRRKKRTKLERIRSRYL